MRKVSLTRIALLCSAISTIVMSSSVMAAEETAADEEEPVRGEIVVTATRDSRSLQDVPMTVNVATGEQLQKLKIFDVKDIAQLAPGLELTNNGGRNNTTSLRGQTFDPDQGTAPTVAAYFNEIPVDAQVLYTALYDIQQIEVLRGPQGLLRGATAPAGSITITSRRPKFDGTVEGDIQVSGTNRHAYNVQGGITVPLGSMFSLRAAGLVDGNRINQVRNITRGGEYSRGRTASGRATLGFKPSDNFTAYFTYQYLHAENSQFQQVTGPGNTPVSVYSEIFGTPKVFMPAGFGGGPFAIDTTKRSGPALAASDYTSVTDGVHNNDLRSTLMTLGADWDLGPVKLSVVGGRQRSKSITNRDQDTGNSVPGYTGASYVEVTYPQDTVELRLASTNPEGFGWGVGFFHTKVGGYAINDVQNNLFWYATDPNGAAVQSTLGTGFFTTPNQLPLAVHVFVPISSKTTAVNANLHYYSGPLKIDAGIRYTQYRKTQLTQLSTSATGSALIPNIGGPGVNLPVSAIFSSALREIIPAAVRRSEANPLTGGASISFEVNDTTNVYVAYGRSFRLRTTGVSTPVGIDANDPGGRTGDLALLQTKDETTNSFEIGIKGSAMDRRLNYSLSAFYQKFNGYIGRFDGIYWVSAADPSGKGFFSFNYNGDASIKGIEASLDGRFTDNWDFGINMAYAHGRYSNAKLPCNDYAGTGKPNQTGAAAITGNGKVSYCVTSGRLAQVPDFSMNMSTEVRFPMGSITPYLRGQFAYRPGFFSDQANYNYQDRELLNLFVGIRGEDNKWSVDLFAKNVLNQQRITNISLGTQTTGTVLGTGFYDSGYRTINTMNPREFGMSASLKF